MLNLTSLLLALSNPALAKDSTDVLVSEFQARDEGSGAFAALLRSYLSEALKEYEALNILEVEDVPDFGEHSALIYLQSCPPGDYVGCALVVGQRAEADYSITGTVTETSRGNRVAVSVIDVAESRESLSFSLDVEVGDDQVFIDGVVELLLAVIEGEAGLSDDVRDMDDPAAKRALKQQMNEDLAAQLNELKDELGDATTVDSLQAREIERSRYTIDDLTEDLESEGTKPWERLGMTTSEYLRYKNSGMSLSAWKQAALGRKNQVMLRGGGGFVRGMIDSEYYARYALESTALSTVATYSWQSAVVGSGGFAGGWVGFGLTPILEVDVGAGIHSGSFTVEIHQDVVARSDSTDVSSEYEVTVEDTREGDVYSGGGFWMGGRVLAGFLPVNRARPVLGGGVTYTLLSQMPVLPPSDVPTYDASTLLQVQVIGGIEASANDLLDFYAVVPVGILVGGRVSQADATGEYGVFNSVQQLPAEALISTSVEVGVAIRLGGKKIDTNGPMDMDFDDY